MTDDPNAQPAAEPESFEVFEAKSKEPEVQPEVKGEPAKDDTLELGSDEAPEVKEGDDKDGKKRNHRPWNQRVDILTARLRDAEQRAATAEARIGTDRTPAAEQAPDPFAKNEDGSDKYEWGENDGAFLKDTARFEARQALREEREAAAETDKKTSAQREVVGKLETGMAAIEKAGPEKYDDFEAKIEAAVEARGGLDHQGQPVNPLHPLVSVGIAVSPAGADIAYRLATDDAASDRIEALAKTKPQAAAMAFGELEGEYLGSDHDDSDLDLADPLDMLRLNGRMKARLAGKSKASGIERKVTKAPEPAEHRSRGANGQFETRPDTGNFAEFERMANRKTG